MFLRLRSFAVPAVAVLAAVLGAAFFLGPAAESAPQSTGSWIATAFPVAQAGFATRGASAR